jgi:hypothetical protein
MRPLADSLVQHFDILGVSPNWLGRQTSVQFSLVHDQNVRSAFQSPTAGLALCTRVWPGIHGLVAWLLTNTAPAVHGPAPHPGALVAAALAVHIAPVHWEYMYE